MPRGDEHNPASQQEQQRRMLQDWYHAPSGPEPGGADTWQPLPHDIIRVRLTADWAADTDGDGVELTLDDSGDIAEGRVIKLRDPLSILTGASRTVEHADGVEFWAIATYAGPSPDDTGPYYEPLAFSPIVAFELKADLSPGSSATAYPMLADQSDADTSAATFYVYDEPEGDRRGLGRDTTGTSGGAHGVRGHASYDSGSGHWQIISLGGQQSIWGKIQSSPTPTNASGATSQTFSAKTCKWDGTGETGSAFDVKTPIRANHDTALFTGYVIQWHIEPDGTKLIDSDCWDDPIGTIRAVGQDDAVRDGWEEITDARGRFLVGKSESSGDPWGSYAATGGIALTNLTLGLQDHPEITQNCLGDGTSWKIHTNLAGYTGPLDHRVENEASDPSIAPPWYAIKWIKRTS